MVCAYVNAGTSRVQRKISHPRKVDIVHHPTWLLGTKLGSSTRALLTLNNVSSLQPLHDIMKENHES